MSDRHYLAKVLGLSVVPRVFTSVLTLISLPVMLRAVGATEYGLIVYLTAVIAVFESFADFGVSSAAGKGIAEARATRPAHLSGEILRWARLQAVMALIGAVPIFGFSYLYVRYGGSIHIELDLLVVMISATWVSICANFVRAGIRSCLDFHALAILDTTESVVRSASWLGVARFYPTALGVAGAALVTAVIVALVGIALLVRVARASRRATTAMSGVSLSIGGEPHLTMRTMLRESVHFLGLRVSTRMTQAVPIVVIGRIVGPDVVGIVGAFAKVSDLAVFPFQVIGNALSVRAKEVLFKDRAAITALWNTVLRFVVLAAALSAGMALIGVPLAAALLPGNPDAPSQFTILAATVLTASVAAMVGPMSDYIGALPKRIALISAICVAEIPVIYAGGALFGPLGAVGAYATALAFTSAGFIFIAKRAFFGRQSYWPAADVITFFWIVLLSFGTAIAAGRIHTVGLSPLKVAIAKAAVFSVLVLAGILATRTVRRSLIGPALFDFTHQS